MVFPLFLFYLLSPFSSLKTLRALPGFNLTFPKWVAESWGRKRQTGRMRGRRKRSALRYGTHGPAPPRAQPDPRAGNLGKRGRGFGALPGEGTWDTIHGGGDGRSPQPVAGKLPGPPGAASARCGARAPQEPRVEETLVPGRRREPEGPGALSGALLRARSVAGLEGPPPWRPGPCAGSGGRVWVWEPLGKAEGPTTVLQVFSSP